MINSHIVLAIISADNASGTTTCTIQTTTTLRPFENSNCEKTLKHLMLKSLAMS